MLDEPLRSPAFYGGAYPALRSMFDEPFFQYPTSLRPAVDVSEQGDHFVVEAELPGVKKENVQVRVGDGGRSVTIEGKVVQGTPEAGPGEGQAAEAKADTTSAAKPEGAEGTERVAGDPPSPGSGTAVQQAASTSNQITSERSFVGTTSFTRTVWLPRPADAEKVSAKLLDGVLTVTIPKATEVGAVNVNVE